MQIELFPEQRSEKVRCKDCRSCNPVEHYGSICILQPTADKRYTTGYIKVKPTKWHYCNKYEASK